jgi:hypothetical protein
MIVIIMGFSKSGTTLTARTLDASGINFRPEKKRDRYPKCPYENLEGCKICMEQIGIDKKKSLYMPKHIIDNEAMGIKIQQYIEARSKLDKDWGFKFPYMTFVYHIWKKYLPEHIAIGVKRSPEGVLRHYGRRGKYYTKGKGRKLVLKVQERYNNLIDFYGIPVIQFEDFIKNGQGALEKIVGRKLPDVRDGKRH